MFNICVIKVLNVIWLMYDDILCMWGSLESVSEVSRCSHGENASFCILQCGDGSHLHDWSTVTVLEKTYLWDELTSVRRTTVRPSTTGASA